MRALGIVVAMVGVACVAPAFVLLWGAILGSHYNETQGTSAFVLAMLGCGILFGGAALIIFAEEADE